MAEYIGFVAPESTVDYSEITGGLVDALKGVQERRDTKRAEMEDMTSKLNQTVSEYQGGKSKSMNDIMLDGAMRIKENIYNANKSLKAGNISPAEYRSIINNTNDYWSTLTASAKSFDQKYQEYLKRQETGEASKMEAELAEYYAEIADLKNSIIHHDPSTGQIYYAKTDADGNITRLDDVRRMNNPGNTVFNKVDLVTIADDVTKEVADWKIWEDIGRGGSQTVSNPRENPAYKTWLRNTTAGILSNDRAATSVLADGGITLDDGTMVSFEVYFDDGKTGDQKMSAKVDAAVNQYKLTFPDATAEEVEKFRSMQEKSMIRMVQDESGDWQPALTDDQRKLAYTRVVDEIEMRLPFEKKGEAQQSYNDYYGVSSSGGGGTEETYIGDYARYAQVRSGWESGSTAKIQSGLLPGYSVVITGNKGNRYITVYQEVKDQFGTTKQKVESYKYDGGDMRDLSNYMFKFGTVKGKEVSPFEQFDRSREAFKSRQGGGQSQGAGELD